MVYNYSFTREAEKDFDEILHYMTDTLDNPSAASAFMEKMEKVISEIRHFPRCGSLVENELITLKDIRKMPISNYLLYYRLNEIDECIHILRIIYGRRNMDNVLNEMNA
ncbi:MAG TPA: type II toxin-antitoxin system RelE/ParE family toxin [Ruminococcaceae bacterium]|nr:type II toxin-antitoxin system RelE/ParE family toxin [Oscillospiraceae bacterium]